LLVVTNAVSQLIFMSIVQMTLATYYSFNAILAKKAWKTVVPRTAWR